MLSISIDKDGNIIPSEELSTDFDISKDVFGPAIFDSSYPYIGFPKKYLNYVKGNLIVKFLKSSCYEKKDEDYSIYYICNKTYIEIEKNYMSFLINRKMFYIFGNDIFKHINDQEYELLITFSKKMILFLILEVHF